jgi:rhodanese-related sulfurtransferase
MGTTDIEVPSITPAEAKVMMAQGNTLVIDVRETHEVVRTGKIAGAEHVPCGLLPFRTFDKSKTILLYCAAGERSAWSGQILKATGYRDVYNLGAFKDWVASGGAVELLPSD